MLCVGSCLVWCGYVLLNLVCVLVCGGVCCDVRWVSCSVLGCVVFVVVCCVVSCCGVLCWCCLCCCVELSLVELILV